MDRIGALGGKCPHQAVVCPTVLSRSKGIPLKQPLLIRSMYRSLSMFDRIDRFDRWLLESLAVVGSYLGAEYRSHLISHRHPYPRHNHRRAKLVWSKLPTIRPSRSLSYPFLRLYSPISEQDTQTAVSSRQINNSRYRDGRQCTHEDR